MPSADAQDHPLAMALAVAVPLYIEQFRAQGGPSDVDIDETRECSNVLGAQGDILLYRGKKPGQTASVFNKVARGIAVLAFQPGGVRFCGHQFRAYPDEHFEPKDAGSMNHLTFAQFSEINRVRCEDPTGFNHPLKSWSLSDWMTAALGELGEAANIVKKLNRVRDGIPGNNLSEERLRLELKKEIADTFIYLDLLAQSEGFTLGEIVPEKFNETSAKRGCSIRCVKGGEA